MSKKLTLITAIILAATTLIGQSIQIDIPGEEYNPEIYKPSSKSDFLKQPYLIFEGINTQMRLIWQLEETATCEISWGSDSTYSIGSFTTTEYGDDHQHSYTITGLTPGTKYHYKVVYSDAILEASFRTAPPDNATDLKFFVYGDTRSDLNWHELNSQEMISAYTANPDFQTISLFTGDHVTYGAYEESWQNYFFSSNTPSIRKRMAELPFVSCLGNHELYYNNYDSLDYSTALYGKYFPFPFVERRYWSFDYGPMHVTVLDQYPDYYQLLPPNGFLDPEQISWVEQDLAATDKPWKIIILHEPGWSCNGNSSGYPHPNNVDVQNLLQPLCEQYGVQMVFAAHNHYYARACKNGVYHITTAGGGAPLYEVEEEFPNVLNTKMERHYCKVEIEGETMSVTAITPYGEVIDEFVVDQEDRPDHLLGFLTKEAGSGLIDDVTISASGQTTTADETGYYGLELVPGYHEATFLLSGYVPLKETVEINEGTETQLDTMLMLGQGCLLEGIIFTTQEEIDNFQMNYPGCDEIEGGVLINGEDITSLNGLYVLTSIGDYLSIESTNLTSLQGLENLYFIGGDLRIGINFVGWSQPNPLLSDISSLENLTSIGQSLIISSNPVLTSLSGLENLTNVGISLSLSENNVLADIGALSSLVSIGGNIAVYNNEVLSSLSGLQNINGNTIESLNITNNTSLSTCHVESICEYLVDPYGFVEIWNNSAGCNSQEEIDSLCNITNVPNFYNEPDLSFSPNPVNDQAVLSLNINSKSSIRICIYNTTGICIKSWQFQNQQPGEKEFKLDLKNLPAGIYFCRVQIGNEMITKKIIKL